MKKLSEFQIHIYENEPSLDNVFPAFIVYNRISNFSQVNFIHAENEYEAIAQINERETQYEGYDPETDYVELSAEEIILDEQGIEEYQRANHN